MNRREFIKLGGVGFLTLLSGMGGMEMVTHLPVEVAAQGKVFRGTHDGKIYVSENGGNNWRLHTNLGRDYAVTRFSVGANNQVQAQVSYQKYTFHLVLSRNGKFWNTATFTYPV